MPIPSLNWQTAHAWLLAHEGYWVLGTLALFVVGLVLLGRPKPEKPWRVRSRPLLTGERAGILFIGWKMHCPSSG